MRIALIAPHFAEYAAHLALALAETDTVQLHLTARNAARELDPSLLAALEASVDLRIHPHPERKWAPLHGLRMALALRRFRPDVVHAQESAEWTLLVARLAGPRVPYVLTVHDPEPHSGADVATRRRTAVASRRLRAGADGAIVHGPRVVPAMERAAPALAGRVHSVMHGILGQPAPAAVARRADAFLFFGRVEAYKGLPVLIEAVRMLEDQGRRFSLTIAGRGGDLDVHREQIAAHPSIALDDRFIPADEVPALFAEAVAVVMPYLDATQSGVAAHAFAAGAPVIASRVGALPDVVSDGVNGLLVPPGDAGALAGAMARLLDDSALAERLSRGAEETARTLLAWSSIAGATRGVYAAALGRNRKLLT